VTWRSFELDPGAPREREQDSATHLAEKYGMSRQKAQEMHRTMTDAAASEGLDFRFDLVRGGNTFGAHRLLHLAAVHRLQDAMKERLMWAYLSEGELMQPLELLREMLERAWEARPAISVVAAGATCGPDGC